MMTAHLMTFMWLWRSSRGFRDDCASEAAYDQVPCHYKYSAKYGGRNTRCHRLELADYVATWGELNRKGCNAL